MRLKDDAERAAVSYRLRPGPKHDPEDLLLRVEVLIDLFGDRWRKWNEPRNWSAVAKAYAATGVTKPKRRDSGHEKLDPYHSWQDLLQRHPERLVKAVKFGLRAAQGYARENDDRIAIRIRTLLNT